MACRCRKSFEVAALLGLVTAFGGPQWSAAAEQELPLQNSPYIETFAENPKISNRVTFLAGVQWAPPDGKFAPSEVGIHVSPTIRGRKACVEINSQDGRYSAENAYLVPGNAANESTFQAKTAYPEELRQHYTFDMMAITVRLIDSCDSADEGTILPATLGARQSPPTETAQKRRLLALINADPHKLTLRLTSGPQEIGHFAGCEMNERRSNVAFMSSCSIAIDPDTKPGLYDLEIGFKERFERVVKHFFVLID